MSNSKNAVSEIKNLMKKFGFLGEDKAIKSYKTKDNTIYQFASLEVGSDAYVINSDYERVPYRSEEHTSELQSH